MVEKMGSMRDQRGRLKMVAKVKMPNKIGHVHKDKRSCELSQSHAMINFHSSPITNVTKQVAIPLQDSQDTQV
jgi:hypothetical protein